MNSAAHKRLGERVPPVLHDDEIPIDAELVRDLIRRAMPQYADLPVRPLASTGSTNALFRLGEELLVRLPRQPGGSATIEKEAAWVPVLARVLPVAVPSIVAVGTPDHRYPERWSVVRWVEGDHPDVVVPETPMNPALSHRLARELAETVKALGAAEVPRDALDDPSLRWYRGEPLATVDSVTRENIDRCRALGDFEFDLDAAEKVWDDAMRLPGVGDVAPPRWYHGDLAAENLLIRDGALAAVLDFGGLAIGDPAVDLAVAWEVLDPPGRDVFRRCVGVDEATWLRGRAWALCIAVMIWYYWATMPARRASRIAVGRNVLADAGYRV